MGLYDDVAVPVKVLEHDLDAPGHILRPLRDPAPSLLDLGGVPPAVVGGEDEPVVTA